MKDFIEFCIHPIKKAIWAPATVFVFYVTVLAFNVAENLPLWWDSAVHFIGGMAICYFFYAATKAPHAKQFLGTHTRFSLFVMLVSLTALAAVLWEIAEWVDDVISGRGIQVTVTDTICDLSMGLAGGAGFAFKASINLHKK